MKKTVILFVLLFALVWSSIAAALDPNQETRGSHLYQKHCSGCHKDAARLKPGVKVFEYTRHPYASMPAFPPERISDEDLRLLAEYVKLQIYYKSQE
jgi:mono/diheme cytochrome c family protein